MRSTKDTFAESESFSRPSTPLTSKPKRRKKKPKITFQDPGSQEESKSPMRENSVLKAGKSSKSRKSRKSRVYKENSEELEEQKSSERPYRLRERSRESNMDFYQRKGISDLPELPFKEMKAIWLRYTGKKVAFDKNTCFELDREDMYEMERIKAIDGKMKLPVMESIVINNLPEFNDEIESFLTHSFPASTSQLFLRHKHL